MGGNVLTSQRVTDVVLMAFQAAANSQGCMNNFTFGNEHMGYYETIAGGAGADTINSDGGADVIVAPRYEVNVQDYFVYKTVNVKVTGNKGVVTAIR